MNFDCEIYTKDPHYAARVTISEKFQQLFSLKTHAVSYSNTGRHILESVRPRVIEDKSTKIFIPYIPTPMWIKLNEKQIDIPKLYWTELTLNEALPQIVKNVFGDDRFVVEIEVLQNHNIEL